MMGCSTCEPIRTISRLALDALWRNNSRNAHMVAGQTESSRSASHPLCFEPVQTLEVWFS